MFWYFPLRPQLKALLKNERYRHLLMHESRRSKKTKYLSDVYDTKRWRKVAGQPTDRLERIVFQICVDAFPWTSRKHAVNTINYVFLLIIYSIARKFEYICNAMPKF